MQHEITTRCRGFVLRAHRGICFAGLLLCLLVKDVLCFSGSYLFTAICCPLTRCQEREGFLQQTSWMKIEDPDSLKPRLP